VKAPIRCFECADKAPATIRSADFLMPVRFLHFGLDVNHLGIDRRLIGVCADCLKTKNEFQRGHVEKVDRNNPNLVSSTMQCATR
jgi:hypothetical protein